MKILYLLMTILKFVGITLLVIMVILLLLLILMLFVPIRYRLSMSKQNNLYAHSRITWFFSIISLELTYDSNQEMDYFLNIFGYQIFPWQTKNKKKLIEKRETEKTSQEETDLKDQKVKKNRQTNIIKTIKQIKEFQYKKCLLYDTMKWIKKLFKEIKPFDWYAAVEVGQDDPADTGLLIGILSILYPLYYNRINIKGNYAKECFQARLKANGSFTLARILYDFIQYLRTQSVQNMIKFIKENRRENKNGRKVTN